MEATHQAQSSNNLLNDTQQSVLPPPQPGIRLKMLSESHWDYPQGCTLLNGNVSECLNPSGEGKDSFCTVPSGEGKDSLCTVSKCIYPRSIFQTTQSKTGSRPGRGQTTIQGMSKTIQVSLHQQRLRRLQQTKCLVDLYSRPAAERRYQSRAYQKQSRVLQLTVPGPKTRQPLEASHRPQLSKQIPGHTKIQDGNPRVNTCLPQERRMGYIHRSDRHLPTCPYSYPVTKVPQVLPQRRHLPIYQSPVWPSHDPIGVQKPCKRSQTYSPATGNQTTPISGRLVDSSSFQTGLHRTNTKTTKTGETPRICSKLQEVRTHTLSEVRLPTIPFFTGHGSCEAHTGQVDKTSGDVPSPLSEVCYQCKDSYIHHWIACINGEDCKTGQDTYETISVASQNSLEISDASGHTNSLESEDDTTWGMVVRPSKCATRRVFPPKGTQNSNLYRRLKRRMGRSLKSRIHRRALVSTQKTPTHQSFRTEGSFSGSTILQKELQQQLSPHSLRQHLRGVIHQQTGRNKISRPMRTDLENSYLVPQQQGNTQSKAGTGFTQWRTASPGGTRSSQQSGPFHLKYSRKSPEYGRVPKWICLEPALTKSFPFMSLRFQTLRLGQ